MPHHLHVIGICGTAMAGLAALAKDKGWHVTGSDQGIYPPMSLFLEAQQIQLIEGFSPDNLNPAPDQVLVGNAISRGNPELEALLDLGIPYSSGAQWLFENVLSGRHPIVVSGTHGKTSTSSLIARVLDGAGWQPGFFIGGIPNDFGQGVRYPKSPWVVVEGDEYDTAFFDKRPKFLHYRPRTLILHNLEFDHADIYPDLEAIRKQFRLLLRSIPRSGFILANGDDPEICALLPYGYSQIVTYGLDAKNHYNARLLQEDGRHWQLFKGEELLLTVRWNLLGRHNILNGLAAATVALTHGMEPHLVKAGLEGFKGVARRLQKCFEQNGITVYDDFAHHPTAIQTTLSGLKSAVADSGRVWAILEPRSNTMRRRIHQDRLGPALASADRIILARPAARGLEPEELLDVDAIVASLNNKPDCSSNPCAHVVTDAGEAIERLMAELQTGDHVVIMSNGGFDGIHDRIQSHLSRQET
ncbi:MAG: UDP-N-acetylmuramate:L-alanyl-gamma-D-glutamyl-meso-diaminopimelate ligase [Magnetococcales bacterium]|nr:UDP-N-acetylmuramate:L-alanyl-gamma-D-glutamyl-meso-diaminopimelate ligase [Magnetococcales bacterium]